MLGSFIYSKTKQHFILKLSFHSKNNCHIKTYSKFALNQLYKFNLPCSDCSQIAGNLPRKSIFPRIQLFVIPRNQRSALHSYASLRADCFSPDSEFSMAEVYQSPTLLRYLHACTVKNS